MKPAMYYSFFVFPQAQKKQEMSDVSHEAHKNMPRFCRGNITLFARCVTRIKNTEIYEKNYKEKKFIS